MTSHAVLNASSFRVIYKNTFKFGVNYNEKLYPVMRVIKLNFKSADAWHARRFDGLTVSYKMRPLIIYPWDESILMLAGVDIPHYIDMVDPDADYIKLNYPGQSKITLAIQLTIDDLLNHTTTSNGRILKIMPWQVPSGT